MNKKRMNEATPVQSVAPRPAPAPTQAPAPAPATTAAAPAPAPAPKPSNKVTLVKFDQNSEQPFEVKFSARGFSVDDTRLSFELLEQALSKNFSITLDGGTGMILTPVKMQKIMKYKDLY